MYGPTAGFEDEYVDVLQNIEHAIVSVYREHDELTGYEAEKAIDALSRAYKLEGSSRPYVRPKMSDLAEMIYERARDACEWRLGRESSFTATFAVIGQPEPITVEEIIACLKRILKSIKFWTKEGGRQGYLQFINEYVP